jgi:acyl carrier protein
MPEPVAARICQIAADIFDLPLRAVIPASSPDTIEGWDSLHHVSFVLALEQTFYVQFLPEEVADMLSIERAALLVEQKLAGVER